MYAVLLYVHILSAFVYFMLHGGVASVTFAVQREQDPGRMRAVESILDLVYRAAMPALWITVLSGVALGFMGGWWRRGWIWASLGLLVVVWILMLRLGNPWIGRQFERVYNPQARIDPGSEAGERPGALPRFRKRMESQMPLLLAVIGILGLIGILWLMTFKPF